MEDEKRSTMLYMVYGITDCPACLRARAMLMQYRVEHVFIDADFSKTYRDSIKKEFEWPTFPIIVEVTEEGEHLVGGYDEMDLIMRCALEEAEPGAEPTPVDMD